MLFYSGACFGTLDFVIHLVFFFSSRRRHTRLQGDWSSDVCSSDLWLEQSFDYKLTSEEIGELDRDALEQRLLSAIDDRYRPEMRRMERMLLLQIVDTEIGRASCRERV